MSWFKPRKKAIENLCHVCGVNKLPDNPAVLSLKAQDGVVEIIVCDECADFFDKSAKVLAQNKKVPESDETI